MDPDGGRYSLQRKVQFDIRFFFCRRGAENIEKMQKSDFVMEFNKQKELWYVRKVKDELTKNHRGMENIISGLMCENPRDKLCPIRSYRMYTERLHPENPYLWQTPNHSPNAKNMEIWYTRGHIGKNPLAKFMSDISEQCNLSKIYHNHSIRVTGCTMLTRMQFSPSEIMSVSGHKSIQSLAIYQKTKDKQKLEMSDGLFQAMTRKEDDIVIKSCQPLRAILPKEKQQKPKPAQSALPAPVKQPTSEQFPVQNKENTTKEIVPFEPSFDDVPDFDLLSVLADIEKSETKNENPAVTTTSNTHNIVNNVPKSLFSNCTIGNIHFHINK